MMPKKIIRLNLILTIGFLLFTHYVNAQRDSLWTIEELSNLTVYLAQNITDTTVKAGTGTLINHNKKFYLLTANHVAKYLNKDPKIVFRIADDKPLILNLTIFTLNNKLNWVHHPEADISIIELLAPEENSKKRFQEWSFPSNLIFKEHRTLARDNDVTFLGFPIMDLDLKHFSPLSFAAYLASGFITGKDMIQKLNVLFFI